MTNLLDRSITESLARMVSDAPQAGLMPTEHTPRSSGERSRGPWLAVAAAAVVVAGIAGIVAVSSRDGGVPAPAAPAASVPAVGARPPGIFPYGGVGGAIM